MKVNLRAVAEGEAMLELEGSIDEDAKFSEIRLPDGVRVLRVDLKLVSRMNSCGIREWVNWVDSMQGKVRFSLRNSPKFIVDQLNMIDGFLPPESTVESFHVPYYCKKCDKNIMELVELGTLSGLPGGLPVKEIKCSTCSETAVLDDITGRYFEFLNSIKR